MPTKFLVWQSLFSYLNILSENGLLYSLCDYICHTIGWRRKMWKRISGQISGTTSNWNKYNEGMLCFVLDHSAKLLLESCSLTFLHVRICQRLIWCQIWYHMYYINSFSDYLSKYTCGLQQIRLTAWRLLLQKDWPQFLKFLTNIISEKLKYPYFTYVTYTINQNSW